MRAGRTDPTIDRKMERLCRGEAPRTIDLFAGCGGISLGFHAEGFRIDAAVELDPAASATHALNFHGGDAIHARPRDITAIEPEALVAELGLGRAEEAFDVIVGGPPCQAYARVGRAKLREVAAHPEAFKVDPRGNLYLRYLHYVRHLKPLAVLVENVPDVLNYGGHNIMGEIAEALTEMGYVARYSLVNTAFHGVPQMRDRVFLIALRQELAVDVAFPRATNHLVLPSGYDGTRAVALKNIDLLTGHVFEPADLGEPTLPGPVTAEQAIGDLPRITLHLEGKLKRGARRFDQPIAYESKVPVSPYARMMRSWPGFEAPADGLRDHVIRFLPRDAGIFRAMPCGGEYPAAHATALRLWQEEIARREKAERRHFSAAERERLRDAMVPPYPVESFPNRWWKLRPDRPSRTLLAHIGKDTYSHIHYDSTQARVISVREAARLQSFPDGFRFSGTMNPAYRQIGNAVPPVMARALAKRIREMLAQGLGISSADIAAE